MKQARKKRGIDLTDSVKVALWSCVKLCDLGYTSSPLFDTIQEVQYVDLGMKIGDPYLYFYTRTFSVSGRYPRRKAWIQLSATGSDWGFSHADFYQYLKCGLFVRTLQNVQRADRQTIKPWDAHNRAQAPVCG